MQAYDADLANIASSEQVQTPEPLAQSSYANMRNTLGVQIDSDVQAYSNKLAQIAGLTNCNNYQIIEQRNGVWTCQADSRRRRLAELDAGFNHPLFASDLRMKDDVSRFPQTKSASEVISTLNIYHLSSRIIHTACVIMACQLRNYEKTNYIVKKEMISYIKLTHKA